uniref:Protein unc-80 homolog n=1 Tax=Timema shepardi TaxID=629360 RepID=A0A7R9AU82_TIMSH|nr:unnamed protein product [Timema shepardi]
MASVNHCGTECPIALRLVACNLLLEITTFLRETYQSLPKSSRASTRERPPPWERMYSREANRRWSMALSSMGHSQTSAQSLQSIAGDREAVLQAERKISFVLHEPDNESEGSSNTTVTMQGEDGPNDDKKGRRPPPPQSRPFLLRRGTAGAPTTGSFKRRSLKLRRSAKETKEPDCDCRFTLLAQQSCSLMSAVKRTDSIQSKRKVSSLSDRSDNSEQGGAGEVSGEESPGILSDDQPPESPSDSNDTDDTSKHLPWMKIYGEEFGLVSSSGGPETDAEKHHREDTKKEKSRGRKVSDQTSTQASPIRRKDSMGKRDRIERNIDGSHSARLLGSHRDSSRDITDQDCERGRSLPRTMPSYKKKYQEEKPKEQPQVLKYIKAHVREIFHTPLAILVKGAVVLSEEHFVDILPVAWELLLESNQELAAVAASLFILAAVKAPNQAMGHMHHGLHHQDPAVRINAILRFQVLWKLRYQVWPRMEEGAHVTFKVPPPGIEFTLPSPKIGIESLPVVDPPWMPQVKTKVEEVTISQESHRSLVTATKTRKKQQTELITMALQAQEDKKRAERENFLITTIPITVQAAYEPSLYHAVGDDHDEGNVDKELSMVNVKTGDEEQGESTQRNTSHHIHSAHSLFPSCLCSAVIQIINLLDDAAVSPDGNAVYEVAYQVIWSCLVEDSALFLRYVLERLTRDKQELMFKILRHLIRFVPKLPQQAAFALYNYIIGYVMFYVRSPQEDCQKLIGAALSILWMVVHSVHGIMFKDLKQILRKEQCDASILLTANVPSAKKIIVHGPQEPDAGGIPSQFPVQEDTQFCQILRESLDFFGIEESRHREFFLVDHKTHQIHNPSSYVRDFYFFKRSQYPQLELIHMKPEDAFNALQKQELLHKFVEIGKVLLTWAILKNVDMVVQRVVFLHEELMKLPSFPRKALEADLDLYKEGEMGKELLGLDVLHKFMWVRLIARMFEAMAGNFAYSGDIHLFLNVLNGAVILHSEDACILRYVTATYINAAHNFKNIFSTNGYLLIMPTLLQLYSNHQTNKLVKTTVEYAVKQFYLMNRKPFILQMFGSVSAILDTDEESQYGDAHKVQSSCLFNLLLSLETPSPDPLHIGELVKEDKPLKAIDFCYHDENEMVTVLDCISLCVMVVAYAADSVRGHQMLTILEAILPCYIQHIQLPSYKKNGKTEKEIIHQVAVAVKTLVNNCEALAKNYNGPQRASPEHKGSSQRNYSRGPYSPGFEFDDDSHSKYMSDHSRSKVVYERDLEDSEVLRNEFRRPRDILLSMVAEFLTKSTARLNEINKKSGQDGKSIELLDIRSHVRLADVAHSLLKVSPYDPDTMACRGLQRYMNDILPSTEWTNEAMRPALITILRRLDKTFNKIYKKPSIRRHTDWEAAAGFLKGIYETLSRYPYIVHMQHLKTLINTCQALIVGDSTSAGVVECVSSATTALMSQVPPPHFCSTVVRLIALQIIAIGIFNHLTLVRDSIKRCNVVLLEMWFVSIVHLETYSLEQVCGGSSVFPTHDKTENILMNLLMPLCLRVGSGRKDVPRMRQADISFALTVVLHAMSPPATKTAPVTAQNIKTASEMRTGSITYSGRDNKKTTKISRSLYQVAFLALKIMLICFESELVVDWARVAKTIRDIGKHNDAGSEFWTCIEFIVTHRTPLFVLLHPFIIIKLSQPPMSDHERHLQFLIREKLKGYNLPIAKCTGSLLMDLAHEMKELKEELEDRRYDEQRDSKRPTIIMDTQQPIIAEPVSHPRTHRPSLIDLLTGDHSANKDHSSADTVVPGQNAQHHRESVSSVSFGSTRGDASECGAADTQSSTTASSNMGRMTTVFSIIAEHFHMQELFSSKGKDGEMVKKTQTKSSCAPRDLVKSRPKVSCELSVSTKEAIGLLYKAKTDIASGVPEHGMSKAGKREGGEGGGGRTCWFGLDSTNRSQQSSASDERKVTCQKTDAFLPPHQKALRFVSSVELRHSSGETSTTPLSPSSPADDSSGEMGGNQANKPRLQRSKAQSRKTFRLRKSRKSHIQVSHIKVEPQELPTVGGQPPPAQQPVMELSVSGIPTPRAQRFSTRQTRSADSKLPDSSWDEVSQTSSTSGGMEGSALELSVLDEGKETISPLTMQLAWLPPLLNAKPFFTPSSFCHDDIIGSEPAFSWRESGKPFRKNPSSPERDSNFALPVLGSQVQHETDALDHSATEAGYHESYSLLMMTLESPPTPAAAPPLASPDIHDLPSTSSATPNYVVAEGSSPDSSINSTGGEDTALLCRNERTSSQHSLLMVFETEDENTLI